MKILQMKKRKSLNTMINKIIIYNMFKKQRKGEKRKNTKRKEINRKDNPFSCPL